MSRPGPPPPRPASSPGAPLHEVGRTRLVAALALGASLLLAIPVLGLVYSAAELQTLYPLAVLALLCQGAEWWDARRGEPAPPPRGLRALLTGPSSASLWMRGVVALVVGYFFLTGIAEIVDGLHGSSLSGAPATSARDAVSAGALLAAASALCLGIFAVGTDRVPGLRGLRPGRPITWLAVATFLVALALNLAPQTATTTVATTIAKPLSTADQVRAELPFGVVAVLLVGPGVRRGARETAARLGAWPLRVPWLALGLAAGLLLVPVTDALFTVPTRATLGRFLEGGLVAAGGMLLLVSRSPGRALPWLVRWPGTRPVLRAGCALAGGLALAAGAAELLGHLADALPNDCRVEQEQVSRSLAGGPNRSWAGDLAVAGAAGVDEELIFRGAIQPRFGVVLTSLLFATYHIQYTCHGLPSVGALEIFVLGLGFGLLRRRGGLWAAVLAHVAYDASILLGHTL